MFSTTKRLIETLEKQIADERALHAAEMQRMLDENQRLRDQCERLTLRVGLPSTVREPPEEPPEPRDPNEMPAFTGSPWERVMQKEMWLQSPPGKAWVRNQLASVRVSTPEVQKAEETH